MSILAFGRAMARGLPLLALIAPVACAPAALDDDGRIVRATLRVLVRDRPATAPALCIDNRTRGEPLAIFRTMRASGNEHELRWRHPAALHAATPVTQRALFEDAIGRNRLRIVEPQSTGATLSAADQRKFDTAATALAIMGKSDSVALDTGMAVPGASPRWWLLNRIHTGCDRVHVLSKIVRDAQIGFVTVSADHWGTTYAVERNGADWRVTAQWNSWLY
ncbi:MAG TPA: hypothetical protein VM900_14575 [Sphingomonas sp.]|jgi:hypothetical protein|nr:hypothetical protein [Sphingomonas sp.]